MDVEYLALIIAGMSAGFSGLAWWQVRAGRKESRQLRMEVKIEKMLSHLEVTKYHKKTASAGLLERIDKLLDEGNLSPDENEELVERRRDILASTEKMLKDLGSHQEWLVKADASKISPLELEQVKIRMQMIEREAEALSEIANTVNEAQ